MAERERRWVICATCDETTHRCQCNERDPVIVAPVSSEAVPPRLTREEMGRVYVAHAEDCPSPAQCTCDHEGLKARVRAALADTETGVEADGAPTGAAGAAGTPASEAGAKAPEEREG